MNKSPSAAVLLLSLIWSSSALSETNSWDAEELGKTYALTELCMDAMRYRHDWRLNRDLKDLLSVTEEEIEESQSYLKKINRGYKDTISDFRKLSKDEQKETCYNLVYQ